MQLPSPTASTTSLAKGATVSPVLTGTHIGQHLFLHAARTQTATPATSSSSPIAMPAYTESKQTGKENRRDWDSTGDTRIQKILWSGRAEGGVHLYYPAVCPLVRASEWRETASPSHGSGFLSILDDTCDQTAGEQSGGASMYISYWGCLWVTWSKTDLNTS